MAHARAHAERSLDAPAPTVYAVLADYTTHHPQIMPPALFSDLTVESGGVGAGTVFHITLHLLGRRQRLHVRVGEPEPGRVLTETNLDTGVVTEFDVTPRDGGSRTLACMSSDWQTGAGLHGLADRFVMPLLSGRIFALELRQLERYLDRTRAGEVSDERNRP